MGTAADNAITFCSVVKSVAALNGLHADFSPKPLADQPGSGQHINISIKGGAEKDTNHMLAGILNIVADMTVFLNPTKQSFHRLGFNKAPKYISWSSENRSQLIRIPAATGEYRRAELRSPDPLENPYIAYTLLIYAGLYGIQNKLELPEPANVNLFTADAETLAKYKTLPLSLAEARKRAFDSSFVREHLPSSLIEYFCNR